MLELLKSAKDRLRLRVVAGGLAPARNSSTLQREGGRARRVRGGDSSGGSSSSGSRQQQRLSQRRLEMRYEKARVFRGKVHMSGVILARNCFQTSTGMSRWTII